MTNLPITSSTMQTAAVSKQTANASDADDAQSAQPFGEVLARQIGEPNAKDVKNTKKTKDTTDAKDTKDAKETKADSTLAADILSQLGADTKSDKTETSDATKTDAVPADTASTQPADMLAALLPQVVNTANASGTTVSGAKSDSPLPNAGLTQDKSGSATQKTDVAAVLQTDQTLKTAAEANSLNPATQVKPQSFAAALSESAGNISVAAELNTAAREAASAATAAAPLSTTAALAALQNSAANIVSSVANPVQVTISTSVTQNKWADEFSQKITWLASSNKDQTAELHLNPPQLGPLDVVIKVSGDQATALFTSPHAAVRDAVEQAMPKLREMLADNGITLGNATVNDQTPRDQGQSGTQRASTASVSDIPDTTSASSSTARVSQISRHNGIVDTFA